MIKLKSLFIVSFLFVFIKLPVAQNRANRLIRYFPAPGQHINIEQIGTPLAAQKMAETGNNFVSLGSFGGYIILGFDKPCVNDPKNPYGVDFTVFGNAFEGSSEPGVVWVMKDSNRNGLPDDIWYEIAGSNHFHSKTKRDFQVTYFKSPLRDIFWKYETGLNGVLKANSFNLQDYFPAATNFIGYPLDSVKFTSTWIEPSVNKTDLQRIQINPFVFGYADNSPKKQGFDLHIPNNPYTAEIEGAGGDPIDIDWCIDNSGKYIDLDTIQFVKIATCGIADLKQLGELSADVMNVVDIEPNTALKGKDKLLVIYDIPEKLFVGKTVFPESKYFIKGRKQEVPIEYKVSDSNLASVSNKNEIILKKPGLVNLTASAMGEIDSIQLYIVKPDSIAFSGEFNSVYAGDTIPINIDVFDNEGNISDIEKNISLSDTGIGTLFVKNEKLWFAAIKTGTVSIDCSLPEFAMQKSITFQVKSKKELIKIFFSVKAGYDIMIDPQWINVGIQDINSSVENRKNNYDGSLVLNLAHGINSGLKNANLNFNFRDDGVNENKLYVYYIEKQGIYYYGWGGKVSPVSFAKCWIVHKNRIQYNNNFEKVQIADGDTISLYHSQNVDQITNSREINRVSHIRIYPNPVGNCFCLEGNLYSAEIEIFDSSGKSYGNFHVNSDKIEIQSEFLKPGLHVIKILNTEGVNTLKFIKK